MSPSVRRRHSPLAEVVEPEDRFISLLREMDPAGEMTKEIDRVELEIKQSREANLRKQGLRRRYKTKNLRKIGR